MGLSRRTEDRWSEIALLKSPFVPTFRNLMCLVSFAELLRVKARPECPGGGTLTQLDRVRWYPPSLVRYLVYRTRHLSKLRDHEV